MSADVLVLLDHGGDGVLRAPARELLTLARELGPPAAVWLAAPGESGPSEQVLEELGGYAVTTVHLVTPDADPHLTPVVAEALASLVGPQTRAVLLTSSFEHKEVAARLGVLTGAGVMVDVSSLDTSGERPVATKQVFAATWTTRCAVRTPLAVLAVKPNAVAAGRAEHRTRPELETHDLTVSASARAVELVERTLRPASGRPDLGAAQVVVVGGRGTDGDFSLLEELADVLGGAVGATRVATDEGWIDRDAQIGQTGVTVAPRLYIGCGVSGAVHHRGGMQASGTIVAINNDADAPIFEIADLGIVGDLREVLPQAIGELRILIC